MAQAGAVDITKATIQEFSQDDCPMMAAALSYYTAFSLPPLLLVLVRGAGMIFGPDRVKENLLAQAQELVGPAGAQQMQIMLQAAGENAGGEGPALLIGIGALLFAATGAFAQLQAALNRTWGVRPDPDGSTIRSFLGKRLLSMGMILTIGFLLLVSLALSAVITAAGQALVRPLLGSVSGDLLQGLDFLANVLVFWLLFTVILRFMPDARVEWRDVWLGAFATTVLFVAGKFAVAFYLGRSDVGEMFGAAGALAVLMLWLYVASMILLLGAEFTEVWARKHGREAQPEPGAVRVALRPAR